MRCVNYTVLLLLLIIAIYPACKNQGSGSKVGALFPNKNSRFTEEAKYMSNKIGELGGELSVRWAERNETKQYEQAVELIDSGAEMLIIVAQNVNTAAAIVRMAHQKGVKVIAYDRLIKNCELDYYITFDGEMVGTMLGEYVLNRVPTGNYILMNGDRGDDNASLFYNGTMKILQPAIDKGKVKIVYSGFIEDWSGVNAAYFTDLAFELGDERVDAIISQYDGLSDGIIKVLKERNALDGVVVTGQDAEIAACHRIMTGEQNMTIYKPLKQLAYRCAYLVFEVFEMKKVKNLRSTYNGRVDVPTLLLRPMVVDKNNMTSTVVADGLLTMDEIMNYNAAK